MQVEVSPVTGILGEENVVIDFGEHEGKSVLEISDTHPDYYAYLIERKNAGFCMIKRSKDKSFRLYVSKTLH